MGALEGRVAVITGAGRGLGRAHALLFAREGAHVVVNDFGVGADGSGPDRHLVHEVVEEIRGFGGEAVADVGDVSNWRAGRGLIKTATDTYGDLHVLVNNAGILRDRSIAKMSETEWDTVVAVHLKGHFVALRHAAAYWRQQSKAGRPTAASVINTSSTSGLQGNPGQSNYGAAKAGIGALTVIAAQELIHYGVRVNTVAPAARTRLTETAPGLGEMVAAPSGDRFDEWDPANISPLVAWLATEDCPVSGRMFYAFGGTIQPMSGWSRGPGIERPGRWTIEEIARDLPGVLSPPSSR